MSECARRCALCFLAFVIVIPLLIKGHELPISGVAPVTFFHYVNPQVRIKVDGAGDSSGIYDFPAKVCVGTVINMAEPQLLRHADYNLLLERELHDGDSIIISANKAKQPKISIEKMSTRERLNLGIPLDIDGMTEADWELLPAIGPALARNIVKYRQNNGDILTFRDLELVSGIGPATVTKLAPFFFSCHN